MSLHRAPACWSSGVLGRLGFAVLVALVLVGAAFSARAASASSPDYMTYQGFLVDANGNPLAPSAPANYPVNFRIYNASSAGTLIWSELQVVTVDKGQFSVVLGEGTAIAGEPAGVRPTLSQVFTNNTASELFIELQANIGGTLNTILPRLRLVTSPYAFLSSSANKLVAPNNGATYVSYNSGATRTEVAGNLNVSGTISGNGSGLTGLTAGQIPNLSAASITSGTLADARLSANVALRNTGNAFSSGNQTINGGNLGVGTTSPNFPLSLGSSLANTKLALWESGPSSAYGFGVQASQFRLHVSSSVDRFSFLNAPAGTEIMTLSGGGNLGIGTNSPQARLHLFSPGWPAQIVESSSGVGTWLSLRNSTTGGQNWNLISSGNQNGEGAGKLLFNSQTGGGTVMQLETSPANKVTINGALNVTGALTSGTDKFPIGSENLRIIRGRVDGDVITPVAVGTQSGWSVSRVAGELMGQFNIDFPAGTFSEAPAVTVTPFTGGTYYCTVFSITTTRAVVVTRFRSTTDILANTDFSFIAVGPR